VRSKRERLDDLVRKRRADRRAGYLELSEICQPRY
jgi:hypothetical protein